MENKFARFISYLAHPLLIPVLGLLIISNSGTYAANIDPRHMQFIYLSVFIFTLLLPAALIPIYYYFGLVRNIEIPERSERLIPLYSVLIFYIIAWYFLKQLPVSFVYQQFILAGCISVLLFTIVSYFWKISAHTTGWGGITGLIVMLSLRFNTDMMTFLIAAIFVSGLIAYARLKLNEHTPSQVYMGFILGFSVVVFILALK